MCPRILLEWLQIELCSKYRKELNALRRCKISHFQRISYGEAAPIFWSWVHEEQSIWEKEYVLVQKLHKMLESPSSKYIDQKKEGKVCTWSNEIFESKTIELIKLQIEKKLLLKYHSSAISKGDLWEERYSLVSWLQRKSEVFYTCAQKSRAQKIDWARITCT